MKDKSMAMVWLNLNFKNNTLALLREGIGHKETNLLAKSRKEMTAV